ncbi:GNAT family N-acetyltransferase [Enterococcus hirae]|uniref:GNAT family N-acetyltransferase n=1 Tax=Enterococcus hirae TaxID=1354 RepID=UPI00339A3202
MKTIEIVGIKETEVEKLQAISIETYQATFGEHNSEELMTTYLDEAYALDKLRRELQEEQSEFYWAVLDDRIAGYLKLNIGQEQTEAMGEGFLEIERIYVRSPFKSKGIGSRLIEFAVQKAQEKQKEAIWLGVWEHNYPALAFYRKHGFQHHSQHIFYMGDDAQTDYLYVKNLQK